MLQDFQDSDYGENCLPNGAPHTCQVVMRPTPAYHQRRLQGSARPLLTLAASHLSVWHPKVLEARNPLYIYIHICIKIYIYIFVYLDICIISFRRDKVVPLHLAGDGGHAYIQEHICVQHPDFICSPPVWSDIAT